MITAKTLTYFLWSEIAAELLNHWFTPDELETYRNTFLLDRKYTNRDEEAKSGAICGYNLYYFGPTEKQIAEDPEEAERAQSIFASAYLPENELLRKITHKIWNLLEGQIPQYTEEDTRIQL